MDSSLRFLLNEFILPMSSAINAELALPATYWHRERVTEGIKLSIIIDIDPGLSTVVESNLSDKKIIKLRS